MEVMCGWVWIFSRITHCCACSISIGKDGVCPLCKSIKSKGGFCCLLKMVNKFTVSRLVCL